MSTPDSSCLYYIMHNREQRSSSVQVFSSNSSCCWEQPWGQWLQTQQGDREQQFLPGHFPQTSVTPPVRTTTEPGKKCCKRHRPASRKPLILPVYWQRITAQYKAGISPQLCCAALLGFCSHWPWSKALSEANSIFSSDCTGFWMWPITASSTVCSQNLGLCFAGNGNRWSQLFFLAIKSMQYLLLIFLAYP